MPKENHTGPETPLGRWRRAHGQLRALERRLIELAKTTEQLSQLEPLFLEIEDMRSATARLFQEAQLASLHAYFRRARHGAGDGSSVRP